MKATKNRAVVVSKRNERLLVIRRVKHGRRYAVLPGGGVELNERSQDGALWELHEETVLSVLVLAYRAVLEEGQLEDLVRVLNRDRLIEMWPELMLPLRCFGLWQARFPELRSNTPWGRRLHDETDQKE